MQHDTRAAIQRVPVGWGVMSPLVKRPAIRPGRGTAATALALLCLLSTFAGCARLAQPGSLPSAQERCANAGGNWSATGALCRYPGQ